MLKVILVDDEQVIVEGLKKVVPWSRFNCSVVAVANDGESGACAIRAHRPDILFTDIKMPNMDGLTMLAGLRSEFPEMSVVVLTGYSDFSYAQQAIRLGVSRFLLKPSKMDEIEEALEAIASKRGLSGEEPAEENTASAANSFVVRCALSFMEEHFAEKLSLADVAERCYVSQWHLSKLLNKHTGQNFYDILNGVRIKAAKGLLFDPTLKISDICEMVGYTDTAHFSRVFKKLEGMSANEYRNTMCKEK
ncbi:MAG: response regulator [Clostridiaceae bacterium]